MIAVLNPEHREAAWRVCVTRDEPWPGPLAEALTACGFEPRPCPVLVERPPVREELLRKAAARLDQYDWIICASARSVHGLTRARTEPWPANVRTAAVGHATARALVEAGADPAPLVGAGDGADSLWDALAAEGPWEGRQVLVLTTPGGRRTLPDRLRGAGATVEDVEAYQMSARDTADIARDWADAAPDAVVIASPRVAARLVEAVGIPALQRLRGVVAIGPTTAEALLALGVRCLVAPAATFAEAARTLADHRAAEASR